MVRFMTTQLQPVYPSANDVTLHIWSPDDVVLSVSDNTLERVSMWKSQSCSDPDSYQRARIMATTTFSSGSSQFTANILPFIAERVSQTNLLSYTFINPSINSNRFLTVMVIMTLFNLCN